MSGFGPLGRVRIAAAIGCVAVTALLLAGHGPGTAATIRRPAARSVARPAAALPPIRHVWLLVLENESASTTFGPSAPAPYLAKTLRSMGLFLPDYYGVGHNSLDNYIAMISGQPPNPETQADCVANYSNFNGTVVNGIAQGTGCVYPTSVPSIADQMTAAGLTWKEYAESMPAPCSHAVIGQPDSQQGETAGDPYTPRHNPFVYFHSIIDNASYCDAHDVNLNALPGDLASVGTTPNYSFITPDVCGDGHDATCTAEPSRPGGFAGINGFLETWVPKILDSPAYKKNGLLIITFDEALTSDASSCCGEQPGATQPLPGLSGPGGGDVGAVLLSPYIKPGSTSTHAYNHYSMLASIENLFGLGRIGMAALAGLPTFGSSLFNGTPPSASCKTSRRLVIELPAHLSRVRVRVRGASAGHRTRVTGNRRAVVMLKGRSALHVTVTVTARRRGGRSYRLVRHYSVCKAG
jgi:phosphatidylinositol-3-phosphatase